MKSVTEKDNHRYLYGTVAVPSTSQAETKTGNESLKNIFSVSLDDVASLGEEVSGQSRKDVAGFGHLRASLEDVGDRLRRRLRLVRASSGRQSGLKARRIETVPGEDLGLRRSDFVIRSRSCKNISA